VKLRHIGVGDASHKESVCAKPGIYWADQLQQTHSPFRSHDASASKTDALGLVSAAQSAPKQVAGGLFVESFGRDICPNNLHSILRKIELHGSFIFDGHGKDRSHTTVDQWCLANACPGNEDWRIWRKTGSDKKTFLGRFDREWLSAPTGNVLDSAAEKSAGSECFTSFINLRRGIFSREPIPAADFPCDWWESLNKQNSSHRDEADYSCNAYERTDLNKCDGHLYFPSFQIVSPQGGMEVFGMIRPQQ
jgi:hypothetical protein